jgi:hypothetical protein
MRKAHHRRSGPALPAARSVLRGVVSVDTPQGLEPFAREDALRQVVEVKSPGALTGAVRLPMLATLCGLGPGRNRAASGRLYNGWFLVARNAAFWARTVSLWPKYQGIPWKPRLPEGRGRAVPRPFFPASS